MRRLNHPRSKFACLGICVALAAAVVFLAFPRTALTPRAIAEALVQRVKAGNFVSRFEIEQLLQAPYERAFEGWDAVYLLGDDGSYFRIDGLWLGIRLQPGTNTIRSAAVFSA